MIINWKAKLSTLSLSWGVFFLFFFSNLASALSLGNLNITSAADAPFEARIPVQLTDAEFKSIGDIVLVEASAATYQKLGINKNSQGPVFELSWVKNQSGKPAQVLIKSEKPLTATSGVFHDLVIELKWSSGLMRRAYTVLSDSSKGMKVAPGESLSQLAQRITPDMAGASFDQTLISLYRANPQAFFAGNIHRLKSGQTLKMPSAAMTNSIPQSEAIRVIENADQSLSRGELDKSSDGAYVPLAESAESTKKETSAPLADRLKIGSSLNDDAEQVEKTKRIEEIVAQEKMLSDAKQRIDELEKNIADLKKSLDSSKVGQAGGQYDWLKSAGIVAGLILMTLLAIFFLGKRNRVANHPNIQLNTFNDVKVSQPSPHLSPAVALSATGVVKNHAPSLSNDDHELISSEVGSTAVPDFAKKLFDGIDLNLETPAVKADVKIQSVAEQRVKLNLAKSYLKIDDISTAELILQELVALREHGASEVVDEARNLISRIQG